MNDLIYCWWDLTQELFDRNNIFMDMNRKGINKKSYQYKNANKHQRIY